MITSRLLLLLLLSFERLIIASAQLAEPQDIWPAVGAAGGGIVWGATKLLQDTVNTFQDSKPDSSQPDPPPNTQPNADNTPSNQQPPAGSPVVAPALDSSVAVPVLPPDPVYKLKVETGQDNNPIQLPGLAPPPPAVAPLGDECDPRKASSQIPNFSTIIFNAWPLREFRLMWALIGRRLWHDHRSTHFYLQLW